MLLKIKRIIKKKTERMFSLDLIKINYPHSSYWVKKLWFWDVFNRGWEPQTFRIFKNKITSDTVYVDLGAYVGPTALLAADCNCKKIFCVEASPVNYKILRQNLRLNYFRLPKFFVDHFCIWSKSGEQISFGGADTSTACSVRGSKWKVRTITIRDYLKVRHISSNENLFVKIDIEGAEVEILDGLASLLERDSKVDIYLSLHPPFIEKKEFLLKKLIEISENFNFLDINEVVLSKEALKTRIMSNETHPAWGTEHGNFFEVLITNYE